MLGRPLVGAEVSELLAGGETLFAARLAGEAETLIKQQRAIASAATEIHEKERLARVVEALRGPLEEYADEHVARAFTEEVGRPFHWELEFPEVFLGEDGRPRPNGGFDAVVGNPPWVRIQALSRELASYCRERYATASGAFDAYVVFLERGLSLLAPDGRLGFIVPNKLLKLDYGQRLRELFARERLVEEIVDFGDAQVFEEATNYSCILTLDRRGVPELTYRRVRGDRIALRQALADLDRTPAERFSVTGLGGEPWMLAAGEEAALLRAAWEGAERLDEVTAGIFTGLQTSADRIYIVEDRGPRGANRLVYSRASDRELELEPDLLHPLASGGDVDRYTFRPLRQLLLFPYRREERATGLLSADELARLSLPEAYLHEHEQTLRGRERGKMDHAGWYAFGRTQSLAAHEQPKLGVAATVQHLEIAADPDGAVYFHNVRVNGILLRSDGPSLWLLLVLLNSRLLDYVFRRGAAEHANGYYAANKQFIAPLPIRIPDSGEASALEAIGERLHVNVSAIGHERQGFLDWLGGLVGARVGELAGATTLLSYDAHGVGDLLTVLGRSRARLSQDPLSRSLREQLEREHAASLDRLGPLVRAVAADEATAGQAVYELYALTGEQQALVDAEFG